MRICFHGFTILKVDFKKVRDILKKISSSNFEKLSEELVVIVNSESKYLPEYANVFVERAVMDANNQSSVVTYAKLVGCLLPFLSTLCFG